MRRHTTMWPLSSRRRTQGALAISLMIHTALVAWMWVSHAPPVAKDASHQAIELTIVEVDAPEKAREPQAVEPKQPAQSQQAKKPEQKSETKPAGPASAEASLSTAQSTPSAQGGGTIGTSAPLALDARETSGSHLTPGAGFTMRLPGKDSDEPQHGHTISNGPGEQPDAVAMAEYKAEQAQRQAQRLTEDMVGAASSGPFLDPYFVKALGAVRGQFDNVDIPTPHKTAGERVKQALGTWQAPAERFGATGSPMTENESAIAASESGMGRAAAGLGNGSMGVNDVGFARSLAAGQQMMAAQTVAIQEITKAQLVTVLELFQVPGGALADATIVKSSGFRDFDEFALHRARKAFAKLEESPDGGFGISPEGWRSVWRFSYMPPGVRVELLRVVKGAPKNQYERAPF